MTPPAIVFGVDEQMALGLLAALGRAGIPVVGLSHVPDAVGFRSKYCTEAKVCPSVFDRPDALLQFFLDELPRVVVLPSYDPFPEFLCRHQDVLADAGFRFLVPDYESYRNVADKGRLAQTAGSDPDLSVPPSRFVTETELQAVAGTLAFPCVLKLSHPWCKDNRIVERRDDLLDGYRFLVDKIRAKGITSYRVLAQRWVAGERILHVSQLVDGSGRQAARMIARRLRVNRSADGSEHDATLLERVEAPDLAERALRFARRHGLRGLMELECKLEDGAPPALLDVNPRVWAWHSFASRNGVDYALGYYRLCLGQEWRATPSGDGPRLHWRLFASSPASSDLHAAFRLWRFGKNSATEILTSLASLAWRTVRRPGSVSLDFGQWRDPRPRMWIVGQMIRDGVRLLLGRV